MHKKTPLSPRQASPAPIPRSTRRSRGRSALVLASVAAGVAGVAYQAQVLPLAGHAEPAASAPLAAVPAQAPATAVAAAPLLPATPTQLKAAATPQQPPKAATASAHAGAGLLASDSYFDRLRAQLRWIPVQVGERKLATPDAYSRLLLAQSAARHAGLHQVGLDWRDVYGVINAETSWVPRTGMGKNGVPSLGLGQFEPATARAIGLKDPHDPVAAVHATAVLLKEAAQWSARRIEPLKLSPQAEARKLREGVSIYYNLSTRARQQWSGLNTHRFPLETQRHIRNVQVGARQAERLQVLLAQGKRSTGGTQQVAYQPPRTSEPAPQSTPRTGKAKSAARDDAQAVRTASAAGQGSIAWSNGSDARKVWTTPQGRVRWSSSANG